MRLSVSPTPSNTPSNTPSVTPSNTSCPIITPTSTQTVTPTLTVTPSTPPTIYLNLCLPDVVPENGIIEWSFYSQVSPDCNSERINVDQTVGLNYDIYVCLPPYGPDDCVVLCGGYVTLTAGTNCNSSLYCDATGLEGVFVSGQTFGNIFPTPTGSINYQIGTICYGECSPCTIPTPTPTASPTLTPTPTVTPTIASGDFLLQEDSFLILQEDGFAILLDVPLPTQTPTLTSTPTLTATPTLTPTTSSVPCDAADYLLFNETGGPLSWSALDCNGNGVGNTIPGGQQANTGCVQVGSLIEGSLTIVSSTPC
jgi:hypothetical protein